MIKYGATKNFQKQYRKLPPKIKKRFKERLRLFLLDPTKPQLRVHPLSGKYKGYWSLNISGDIRALFRWENEDTALFTFIGTHTELYG